MRSDMAAEGPQSLSAGPGKLMRQVYPPCILGASGAPIRAECVSLAGQVVSRWERSAGHNCVFPPGHTVLFGRAVTPSVPRRRWPGRGPLPFSLGRATLAGQKRRDGLRQELPCSGGGAFSQSAKSPAGGASLDAGLRGSVLYFIWESGKTYQFRTIRLLPVISLG